MNKSPIVYICHKPRLDYIRDNSTPLSRLTETEKASHLLPYLCYNTGSTDTDLIEQLTIVDEMIRYEAAMYEGVNGLLVPTLAITILPKTGKVRRPAGYTMSMNKSDLLFHIVKFALISGCICFAIPQSS